MKHAREDYARFQDPALNDPSLLSEGSTPIAEDEPVLLFRAQDKFFIPVMEYYKSLLIGQIGHNMIDTAIKVTRGGELESAVVPEDYKNLIDMIFALDVHGIHAMEWQYRNKVKTPDIPPVTPITATGRPEDREKAEGG